MHLKYQLVSLILGTITLISSSIRIMNEKLDIVKKPVHSCLLENNKARCQSTWHRAFLVANGMLIPPPTPRPCSPPAPYT